MIMNDYVLEASCANVTKMDNNMQGSVQPTVVCPSILTGYHYLTVLYVLENFRYLFPPLN